MRAIEDILNTVQNADSLSFVETLPDESVDLIICDGPYGVTTHHWDAVGNIQEYNLKLIQKFARVLKRGGALYLFGKHDCIDFIDYRPHLDLSTKIVWYQPSRLAQGRLKYTNNYDLICYFTKGKCKTFNLDEIRVAQLVELEHRLRCERVPSVKNGPYGKTVFNDRGKNPGDVWGDIKQLTYKSKELLNRELLNTIQKPERLLERLVRANSNPGDIVFDPFCGSGTVPVVCRRLDRRFIACEINTDYVDLAKKRLAKTHEENNIFQVSSDSFVLGSVRQVALL